MSARAQEHQPAWPALMRPETAGAYLDISAGQLVGLASRAGVRPVDLGSRSVRYRKADLDALIDRLAVGEAPSPGQAPALESDAVDAAVEEVRGASRRKR